MVVVIWRHGGVDGGGPAKDGTSICLEMVQWKMVETTLVSASDRFIPQTRYVARLGIPAFDVRFR